MQTIEEDAASNSKARKVLVAIDDNYACERALDWTMREFYREGDEIHLIYVIPRKHLITSAGAPPVDSLPQEATNHDEAIDSAHNFIKSRFITKLDAWKAAHRIHVVKGGQDSDSIGNSICDKAVQISAVTVILASQGKSRFQEFFLGSTSAYEAVEFGRGDGSKRKTFIKALKSHSSPFKVDR